MEGGDGMRSLAARMDLKPRLGYSSQVCLESGHSKRSLPWTKVKDGQVRPLVGGRWRLKLRM